MVDTQFGAKVKIVRSDNGHEISSKPMKTFCWEKGVIHQTSCIDTPQQVDGVERKYCHILNVARAL